MPVTIGQPAPDFALYDTEKKKINLTDRRGKPVLILFFPFAFTGTCTKELCSVRDDISTYNKVNVTVFGISVDSLHTLKKYKEDQKLNFTLLSDFNKEVSAEYGSLYEVFGQEMKGVSKRSAFLLDKEGIVRYAEVLENAGDIPDFQAIKNALSHLN